MRWAASALLGQHQERYKAPCAERLHRQGFVFLVQKGEVVLIAVRGLLSEPQALSGPPAAFRKFGRPGRP